MNNVLSNLEPKLVFKYFEEISCIPRCSGKEKKISDFLVNFAKEHNLYYIQDEALNVIIKKPATSGYDSASPIILQGHMDMVCEKNKDTIHDFDKDALQLQVKEDMIYASGTTLGADNGIALAYALAILAADDIPHPPLEVVITAEEEVGLRGINLLDVSHLSGSTLINLDSEEEGKLLVSCAGGIRTQLILPISWELPTKTNIPYLVSINGLKGGHSGMDIHKERANANKLMGRFLNVLTSELEFAVAAINGGAKMNAIPREADAIIFAESSSYNDLLTLVQQWNNTFRNDYKASDPNVMISIEKLENHSAMVFSKETKNKLIASLLLIPNGIQSMSMEIEGLVESSSNLGVVITTEDNILFESATRSSVKSLKQYILHQSETVASLIGAKFTADADYPEWQYDPDSKIRTICQRVYKDKFGVDPVIYAIHAGVECGILKEKKADLDMISFGPNIYDVHTPNEHMNIPSVQRTWEFLLAILKEAKNL